MAVDEMLFRAEASRTLGKPETASIATLGVLIEAAGVRRKQVDKGYTPEHDDEEGLAHLLEIANLYNVPMGSEIMAGEAEPGQLRDALLNQIAILVAAVEVIDRAGQ